MTSLFEGDLKKATREVVLIKENYLQITDRGTGCCKTALSVCWTLVTRRLKVLDPHTIELTKEGKKLHLIIDSPASAFSVVDNTWYRVIIHPIPNSVRIFFDTG